MGNMGAKIRRIPTYIEGLDEEIEGGIPEGFVNLISGVTGTMKSSIAFNIIYNEALKGKNSLYISIEQPFNNFSMQLSSLNIDLSKINVAIAHFSGTRLNYISKGKKSMGTIVFLDVPSARYRIMKAKKFGDLVTTISTLINELQKRLYCQYLVLDSLNALYAISNIKNPRETLFNMFEFFRSKNLTSYLILEVSSDKRTHDQYIVENYLADSIIFLDLARYGRIVQREISIAKMRATKSNVNIFTLTFEDGRFKAILGGKTPIVEFDERSL